jgi:membrane-associated PAP2 superfamily phosphatase
METTDIDRMVTYWTFDATTHTFPLRHAFLLEKVLHDWAKYVVQVFALCVLCAFLMTWRIARLRPYRKMLLFLWLALALATSSVTLLKDITHKDCPWDLEEFGGYAPYLRLFDAAQSAYKPGRCFPAGHASTGFSLMALYFVGHVLNNRRLAWGGLIFGIGAGFLLGGARMLQGAHFLSHTLWSAVVCWVVIVTLYWAFYMRKVDNRTTSSEPVQQQSTT